MTKKLSKSARINIRNKKSEIRKNAETKQEAKEKIKALVSKAYGFQ